MQEYFKLSKEMDKYDALSMHGCFKELDSITIDNNGFNSINFVKSTVENDNQNNFNMGSFISN